MASPVYTNSNRSQTNDESAHQCKSKARVSMSTRLQSFHRQLLLSPRPTKTLVRGHQPGWAAVEQVTNIPPPDDLPPSSAMRVRHTALDTRAVTGMPVNPDTNAILRKGGGSVKKSVGAKGYGSVRCGGCEERRCGYAGACGRQRSNELRLGFYAPAKSASAGAQPARQLSVWEGGGPWREGPSVPDRRGGGWIISKTSPPRLYDIGGTAPMAG